MLLLLFNNFLSYALLNSAHLFLGGTAPGTSTYPEQKSCIYFTIHAVTCQPPNKICNAPTLYNPSASGTI